MTYGLHFVSPFSELSMPRTCRNALRILPVLHLHLRTMGPERLALDELCRSCQETLLFTFFKPPVTSLKKRFLQSLLLLPGIIFAIFSQSIDLPSEPGERNHPSASDQSLLSLLEPYLVIGVGLAREVVHLPVESSGAGLLTLSPSFLLI